MRPGRATLGLFLGMVLAIAFIAGGGLGNRVDPPHMQSGPTETPAGYVVISPPADRPTAHKFADANGVTAYVREMMDTSDVWTDTFVTKTQYGYIAAMTHGNQTAPPPQSTEQAEQMGEVVWIVGFRAETPFPVGKLHRVISLYNPASPRLDTTATEGYVVLSPVGWIKEVGTLNQVNVDGTPEAFVLWSIEDIDNLPASP